jgi:hypothetical protein
MKLGRSKLRQNVQRWGAQVGQEVIKQTDAIRARVQDVDGDKLQAELRDAATEAQALAASAVERTRSFVAEAREAWATHGEVEAALHTAAETPDATEAQAVLQDAPPEAVDAAVKRLEATWTAELGEAGAKAKLDALHARLEAMETVGDAHDRRARSVPRHQGRPPSVRANLMKAVGAIRGAVDQARSELSAAELPDLYTLTSDASEGVWAQGERLVRRAASWAGEGGVGESVGRARQRLGEAIDGASPEWLRSRYQAAQRSIREATAQAETVLSGLDGLEASADDRDAMFERLDRVLGPARNALDPEADAVSVGFLKEAAGGASGARGKELVYIRDSGELRVVDLRMSGARLAVGASKRPFARSLYGEAEAIKTTEHRQTGEVGAMIFHVGSSAGSTPGGEDTVKSWHGALSVGVNASLPLVGDQSIYGVREATLAVHPLTDAQIARLEAHLEGIPDSSRGWTSAVRQVVGHAPHRAS